MGVCAFRSRGHLPAKGFFSKPPLGCHENRSNNARYLICIDLQCEAGLHTLAGLRIEGSLNFLANSDEIFESLGLRNCITQLLSDEEKLLDADQGKPTKNSTREGPSDNDQSRFWTTFMFLKMRTVTI